MLAVVEWEIELAIIQVAEFAQCSQIIDWADSIDQLIECSAIWQWLSWAKDRSWFFTRMIIERNLIADC